MHYPNDNCQAGTPNAQNPQDVLPNYLNHVDVQGLVSQYFPITGPHVSLQRTMPSQTFYHQHKRLQRESKQSCSRPTRELVQDVVDFGDLTTRLIAHPARAFPYLARD